MAAKKQNLMAAKKQRKGMEEEARIRYSPEGHALSDLLPPTRPQLLLSPPPNNVTVL
jgi:hypothetical protein